MNDQEGSAQRDKEGAESHKRIDATQQEALARLTQIEVRLSAYQAEAQMNERAMGHGREKYNQRGGGIGGA